MRVALCRVRQFFLRLLALADVVEKNSDVPILRLADPKRIDVVVTMELFGPVLETQGYAGQGDVAVDLEPMLFVLRRDLAHRSAYGVFDARLPLERRIDFEEAVIQRPLVFVRRDFDDAETFVYGFKECAAVFFPPTGAGLLPPACAPRCPRVTPIRRTDFAGRVSDPRRWACDRDKRAVARAAGDSTLPSPAAFRVEPMSMPRRETNPRGCLGDDYVGPPAMSGFCGRPAGQRLAHVREFEPVDAPVGVQRDDGLADVGQHISLELQGFVRLMCSARQFRARAPNRPLVSEAVLWTNCGSRILRVRGAFPPVRFCAHEIVEQSPRRGGRLPFA